MTKTVDEYRRDGNYLPDILQDFDDQKDLFRAIHDTINVEGHQYAKDIDWVTGQCYVIDIFLWFMAAHGYKLQKARADVEFRDIDATVQASVDYNRQASLSALKALLSNPIAEEPVCS